MIESTYRTFQRRWLMLCTVLLAGCSGTALINAVTPADSYTLRAGLTYGPSPRQQADLYVPKAMAPAGGYPLVVFFYGGTWNSGNRVDYRFVGEALAARGVMVLVADYRLYPAVSYPGFLRDGALAIRLAFAEARDWGANPDRIFLLGHSAGAYNAAMLALDPRWLGEWQLSPNRLAGWGGLAGPYDFLPVVNPEARPVFHYPDTPSDSQPINHVSGRQPPAFLAVARDDDLVNPQRNTGQLANRLRAGGTSVTHVSYDRVSHMTLIGAFSRPLRFLAPVLDDFVRFMEMTGPGSPPRAAVPTPQPSVGQDG